MQPAGRVAEAEPVNTHEEGDQRIKHQNETVFTADESIHNAVHILHTDDFTSTTRRDTTTKVQH